VCFGKSAFAKAPRKCVWTTREVLVYFPAAYDLLEFAQEWIMAKPAFHRLMFTLQCGRDGSIERRLLRAITRKLEAGPFSWLREPLRRLRVYKQSPPRLLEEYQRQYLLVKIVWHGSSRRDRYDALCENFPGLKSQLDRKTYEFRPEYLALQIIAHHSGGNVGDLRRDRRRAQKIQLILGSIFGFSLPERYAQHLRKRRLQARLDKKARAHTSGSKQRD
jgi:hypothetical protein